MFEKEAEETVDKSTWLFPQSKELAKDFWQKGAEFGYNKANEWHYVKDELPPSGEIVLLYFGTDILGMAVICTGCVDCKGEWYKTVDVEPIKWKEIVLPKESE